MRGFTGSQSRRRAALTHCSAVGALPSASITAAAATDMCSVQTIPRFSDTVTNTHMAAPSTSVALNSPLLISKLKGFVKLAEEKEQVVNLLWLFVSENRFFFFKGMNNSPKSHFSQHDFGMRQSRQTGFWWIFFKKQSDVVRQFVEINKNVCKWP